MHGVLDHSVLWLLQSPGVPAVHIQEENILWELPKVWNKCGLLWSLSPSSCQALKATRQNCFRDGQVHQASLEGKEICWRAEVWPGHPREGTGLGPVSLRVWDNRATVYGLWGTKHGYQVKGTEIPSLLQRILPFNPRSKPSFLIVDGHLVWLNIFLYHAAKTDFFPLSGSDSESQDKGTCNPLITEHVGALISTSPQKATPPFPIPALNITHSTGISRTCLMMAVSAETHEVHSNATNFSLKRSFGHNDKFFLKNFKAIAQNWTHGPDISSHTNCSSRNSSNKEKSLTKTTAHHPAEIIPCTWN